MKNFSKIIEYLFYLFVLLLPLQTRWIWHYGKLGDGQSQYLTYSLYGTEILLALILILALIYFIRNKSSEFYLVNYRACDFYALFLLLFIIIAIGLIWAFDRLATLYYLWKFFEGLLLLIFVVNFKISFFKTAMAFVLAGLGQAALALYQFFTQRVFASKWLGMAEQLPASGGTYVVESNYFRWLRAYGTLPHPNVLGGFLAIVLIFLFILILLASRKWERIFLWLCLPLNLAGLFFTFSKSAFLALALGLLFLIFFTFLSPEKKDKVVLVEIIAVCLATLAILILIYHDPILTRLYGSERLEIKSSQERTLGYEESKKIIEKNWLTGVGLGNFTLADYLQDEVKRPSYFYQPVHNVFFLAAVELGIWGFLILVLIVAEVLRRIYNYKIDYNLSMFDIFKEFKIDDNYSLYREKYFWFIGLVAIIFAILVIMVFDHYFWTLYFGIILWWLCLGLWLKQIMEGQI
jgi:hypothetical protein